MTMTGGRTPAARAVLLAAVLAAGLTVLSGCATIPRTGPVLAGRAAGDDRGSSGFQLLAEGPARDATPLDVVHGFLRAAAGFSDYEVARSFLAPSRQESWRPTRQVLIYQSEDSLDVRTDTLDGRAVAPGALPAATTSSVVVAVSTLVIAKLDADGRYATAAAGGAPVTARFGLSRVRGQWRIDHLADGSLVTGTDFAVAYRAYPIYFVEPGGRYLVPDLHWFPGIQELPVLLVRALLAGPPAWLAPAVISGLPAGTTLRSVSVTDDTATVDLDDTVDRASGRQRGLLAAQLQETLVGWDSINAVRVTANGARFDLSSGSRADAGDQAGRPQADPQVDYRPVVLTGQGRLAWLDGGKVEEVPNVAALGVPGASRPAVAPDESAFAVLGPGGGSMRLQLPGTTLPTVVDVGAPLTAPSFDPQGWVWTAEQASPAFVLATRTGAPGVHVSATWLAGCRVVSLRASRDGARMLIAGYRRGHPFVWVAGVQRGSDGTPMRLTAPTVVLPDVTDVVDAAWVDEDQVVLLGDRAGSQVPGQPWLVQVGGTAAAVAAPPGALSIAAGNGELMLAAGTPTGLVTRAGANWPAQRGVFWPAYPG